MTVPDGDGEMQAYSAVIRLSVVTLEHGSVIGRRLVKEAELDMLLPGYALARQLRDFAAALEGELDALVAPPAVKPPDDPSAVMPYFMRIITDPPWDAAPEHDMPTWHDAVSVSFGPLPACRSGRVEIVQRSSGEVMWFIPIGIIREGDSVSVERSIWPELA